MIKIEKTEVVGFEQAIRGMRNPMNSHDRSDSFCQEECHSCPDNQKCGFYFSEMGTGQRYRNGSKDFHYIGPNDLSLMTKLSKGGPVHAKYRRMIVVYADITAPLYWWKEFDTYKVGTVANSCSTMHKIHDKEFTIDDFSHEHLNTCILESLGCSSSQMLEQIIDALNDCRTMYNSFKVLGDEQTSKRWWWQMIQLLPTSYNQKRTVMLNYEVLNNIRNSRANHKLDEWREFCKWTDTLPYIDDICPYVYGGNDVQIL